MLSYVRKAGPISKTCNINDMKIKRATELNPDDKGWLCYFSTQEILLIRQLIGASTGANSPVNALASSMRMTLFAGAGLPYIDMFEPGFTIHWQPGADQRLEKRANKIDGVEDEDE